MFQVTPLTRAAAISAGEQGQVATEQAACSTTLAKEAALFVATHPSSLPQCVAAQDVGKWIDAPGVPLTGASPVGTRELGQVTTERAAWSACLAQWRTSLQTL